jgi:hypothetical protein
MVRAGQEVFVVHSREEAIDRYRLLAHESERWRCVRIRARAQGAPFIGRGREVVRGYL